MDTVDPSLRTYGLPHVREQVLGGVATSTVYKLVQQGRFPAPIKVGRRNVWRHTDLVEWLENQTASA